jgi:CTP:molybdopterin cytidylyltransferase MocA
VIEAKHIQSTLRDNPGFTRAKHTNDLLALASGQSRRMRRWRDLCRWLGGELGDERMASEAVRAQVIALINAILASEEMAMSKDPVQPFAAVQIAQTIRQGLAALGLDKEPRDGAPGSRLLGIMGEGDD